MPDDIWKSHIGNGEDSSVWICDAISSVISQEVADSIMVVTLKMELASYAKTLVFVYHSSQCYTQEACKVHLRNSFYLPSLPYPDHLIILNRYIQIIFCKYACSTEVPQFQVH